MEFISIRTPQNVVISYPLSSVGQRVVAYILDLIFLWLFLLLQFWWFSELEWEVRRNDRVELWFGVFIFCTIILVNLLQEYFTGGWTLGKLILGIKVLKTDGSKPKFSDFFLRWIMRPLDLWFSGCTLAMVMVNLTDQRQRLGDIMAGTTVVAGRYNDSRLSLDRVQNRKETDHYEQKFTHIKEFDEEEMVLVKNCLARLMKYNNQAHKEAFEEMVKRVAKRLQIKKIPANKQKFVKEVIKDYVLANR